MPASPGTAEEARAGGRKGCWADPRPPGAVRCAITQSCMPERVEQQRERKQCRTGQHYFCMGRGVAYGPSRLLTQQCSNPLFIATGQRQACKPFAPHSFPSERHRPSRRLSWLPVPRRCSPEARQPIRRPVRPPAFPPLLPPPPPPCSSATLASCCSRSAPCGCRCSGRGPTSLRRPGEQGQLGCSSRAVLNVWYR